MEDNEQYIKEPIKLQASLYAIDWNKEPFKTLLNISEIEKRGNAERAAYDKVLNNWKAKEYAKEALELASAFLAAKGIKTGIKIVQNLKRAKEIQELLDKRKEWGIVYRQAENNPDMAVDTLIKNEKGFVPNVSKNDKNKSLDLFWGEHNPETGEGAGLTHLIQQRNDKNKIDGEKFARTEFVDLLKNGHIAENKKHPERGILENEITKAAYANDWNGKPWGWIITAFPKNKSEIKRYSSSAPVQNNLGTSKGYSIKDFISDNNIISNVKGSFKAAYQKIIDKLKGNE